VKFRRASVIVRVMISKRVIE